MKRIGIGIGIGIESSGAAQRSPDQTRREGEERRGSGSADENSSPIVRPPALVLGSPLACLLGSRAGQACMLPFSFQTSLPSSLAWPGTASGQVGRHETLSPLCMVR